MLGMRSVKTEEKPFTPHGIVEEDPQEERGSSVDLEFEQVVTRQMNVRTGQ